MRKIISSAVVFLFAVLLPYSAHACAICFGQLNGNMSKAFFWGVLLLLLMPFALAGFLIGMVVHHTRKNQRQHALAGRPS